MRRIFSLAIIPLLFALILPASASAATPASTPVTGKIIALDAGHGGDDSGAYNYNPDHLLAEKDMDISVVNLLKEKLERDGAHVVLTRTGDESVELVDRVARANAAGAQVLISVHHNSADPSVNGTESYFTQADDQPVAEAMQRHLVSTLGTTDRGVKYMPDFAMTRRPNMPSTITEASFVSNDAEAHAIRFGNRVQQEADALYQGLIDYLGQ